MTVEIRVGDLGDVQIIGEALGDLRDVLDGIGALLSARAVGAFRQQRLGRQQWAARMNPNVPGIVLDLNAGRFPLSRRFDSRPAVVDTGTLRNSITWQVGDGGRSVTVGTAVPYAAIHNEGGQSEVTLEPRGRATLFRWLRSLERSRRRELNLGWLFNRSTFTVNVRKRPFLQIEREERRIIVEEVEAALGQSVRLKVARNRRRDG